LLRFAATPLLRHPASRYTLALVAAVAALYLRKLLVPLLGMTNPYHTVWLAVAFCAWFCGVGPSILATVVMVLGISYWFLPPAGSWTIADPRDLFGVAAFLVFAGIIILIGERARRTQAKLNIAHDEMESTVKQRTAELANANQKLRELSTSLLHTQDAERRRLARDLHDSLGQLLAVIGMNLSAIDREPVDGRAKHLLEDSQQLVDEVLQQIRTISHLLHPPMLDESGLRPALKIYVDGFAQRSKIASNLQVPRDLPRFSQDLEIAIFRVVQECLTNVHKHAAARSVGISVRCADDTVVVQICDDGKGMPAGQPLGVGLTGMQERMRELHGILQVHSNSAGTTITATFPAKPKPTLATATAS
jgi:signal transduction histidine kinase